MKASNHRARVLGCILTLAIGACSDDSDEHDPVPPRAGCGGLGVKVGRYPAGVDPTSLAAEISDEVPGVACGLNKITGAILCTPKDRSCGLRSKQDAEPVRMQVEAYLAKRGDAAAEDAYAVSTDCACYSD